MKKYLSIALRGFVATAGVVFICFSLTWQTQVILPAGFSTPGVAVQSKPLHTQVVQESKTSLTLRTPDGHTLILPHNKLGHKANQPHLRPSIGRTLSQANYLLALVGLVLCGVIFPLQSWRWLILLRSTGLFVTYKKSWRLTLVGQFFNFCMPGTTGGDVMKAYYAAKNSGQRGAAVMSVFFDRLSGLLGLLLLGGIVGFAFLDDPTVRVLMLICWGALLLLGIAGSIYFSSRLRRILLLDRILALFPQEGIIGKLQRMAKAFSNHPIAVGFAIILSLPVQLALMASVGFAGQALGMQYALWVLIGTLPLIFIAGALPITYQGIGVMEGLGIALLTSPGLASPNQVIAMFLLYRLFMIVYALVGSLVLLQGDVHLFPEKQQRSDSNNILPQGEMS